MNPANSPQKPQAGIEEALALAVRVHAGQRDKAGQPYILHPLHVMVRVEQMGGSESARIAAILHDVVEDSCEPNRITLDDLRAMGFSEEIVAAVDCVTKRPEEHGPESYLKFVQRAACNPTARLVKIADLEDNLDGRRLLAVTEKDLVRIQRYLEALRYLKSTR